MIVTRTPLRISLGGGGTDLPFYCSKFGASLITSAINKFIYISISPRLDKEYKLNYSRTEIVREINQIKHPLIRESLKFIKITKPLEIHSTAEIPSGTGLGSSSTYLVGLLNALYYHNQEIVSKYKLAEDSSTILMDKLKEPCGKQDQYAAAFGNLLHLKINTSGRVIVSPININYKTLKELEKNLLLFYTGLKRSANEVLTDQKKIAEEKPKSQIFEHYHKIKKIGSESLKCLEKGNLRRFGEWMNAHWNLKRELSDKITNPKIDKWYELALSSGAIGGKLIGAGGGGFMLFYTETNHEKLKQILSKEGLVHTEFKFDFDGSKIVYDGTHF